MVKKEKNRFMAPANHLLVKKIKFQQFHKPSLESGDYTINITPTFSIAGTTKTTPLLETNKNFSIHGDRFTLARTDVHAVYPPPGSFGDYDTVLPHIILNRSTLPWEREPYESMPNKNAASWLVLLLFSGAEKPTEKTTTLKKLINSKKLNGYVTESSDDLTEKINTIEVEQQLLKSILPSLDDLEYLSHIRLNLDENKHPIGEERATILCNRLPSPGSGASMHLVSVENRFEKGEFNYGTSVNKKDLVTLVSLYSWNFASKTDEKGNFEDLLKDLKVAPLRSPIKGKKGDALSFLKKGFIPLRHEMRYGQKTVSWYHGPLAPAVINWPAPPLPATSADKLLHYNKGNGLFDVSYAAAWELGRKLALEDTKFSMALFHWKKEMKLKELTAVQMMALNTPIPGSMEVFDTSFLGKAEDLLLHGVLHETLTKKEVDSVIPPVNSGIPPIVENFFYQLRRLEGIPFNYLVPDDTMLPQESIRFFRLDHIWMDCLLDGAYSLGADAKSSTANKTPKYGPEVTGFLLRSEVLKGWPGLLINAYQEELLDPTKSDGLTNEQDTEAKTPLTLIRKDYLSDDLLLVIFEGDLHTVDFFTAEDTLHFGVEKNGEGQFLQHLRNNDGHKPTDDKKTTDDKKITAITVRTVEPIPFNENRVININLLATDIKIKLGSDWLILKKGETFCSAHFALQMMEGAEKLRIVRTNDQL
ncbi:MAG: hypothetical protein JKY48_15775 [Flavobacteriales bacterium]|nr:hypothetical protein [Flavobacteriales bacterium]